MAKREWTPEERAAHAVKMRAIQAERRAKWATPQADVAPEPEPPGADDGTYPEEPAPVMPPVESGAEYGLTAPVPVEPAPANAAPAAEATAFDIYMASLSEETRELLSVEELRGAFDAAVKQADDERRKELRKAAAAKALHHAKAAAGLLPKEKVEQLAWQERMNQKVRFRVLLPFLAGINDSRIGDEGLRIDGKLYQHGVEAEMTMGEYLSVREMIWRMGQHELDFKGEGRLSSLRRMLESRGFDEHGVRQ